MKTIAWLMLLAAFLPYFATVASKAGGKAFDNNAPRAWLLGQQGWRARANAAQSNAFEGLPFFFAAVLFALYGQAELSHLAWLMVTWIAARLVYLGVYIAGYASVRTLVWAVALALNIAILFSGA